MKTLENNILARNWPVALKNCNRLIELQPNSFKTRLYRANIYFTVGRLSDAISEYKEALKISPENPSAATNLGLAYFESKDYTNAKEMLESAVRSDPNNQMLKQKLEQAKRALNVPR